MCANGTDKRQHSSTGTPAFISDIKLISKCHPRSGTFKWTPSLVNTKDSTQGSQAPGELDKALARPGTNLALVVWAPWKRLWMLLKGHLFPSIPQSSGAEIMQQVSQVLRCQFSSVVFYPLLPLWPQWPLRAAHRSLFCHLLQIGRQFRLPPAFSLPYVWSLLLSSRLPPAVFQSNWWW